MKINGPSSLGKFRLRVLIEGRRDIPTPVRRVAVKQVIMLGLSSLIN